MRNAPFLFVYDSIHYEWQRHTSSLNENISPFYFISALIYNMNVTLRINAWNCKWCISKTVLRLTESRETMTHTISSIRIIDYGYEKRFNVVPRRCATQEVCGNRMVSVLERDDIIRTLDGINRIRPLIKNGRQEKFSIWNDNMLQKRQLYKLKFSSIHIISCIVSTTPLFVL